MPDQPDGIIDVNDMRRMERPAPRARARWRGWVADLCALAGLGLLAIGCGMVYTPLAFIVVGVVILAGGVLLARRP